MKSVWAKVDGYFGDKLAPSDTALDAALIANRDAGLPSIDVSRLQGKFLELLVRLSGAKRVLEIGTLGGYSTIWLARAVGADGHVVTLEANPDHAKVARSNLEAAGLLDRVDVKVGRALETLPSVERDGGSPFDFIFIDADKPSNPDYLAWALRLSRPGTAIVVDNVVRNGEVVNANTSDSSIQGVRRFTDMVAAEPRLTATALQTVGAKGYDGFALAIVLR